MKSNHGGRREIHGNPFLQENVHDPYRERRKQAGTMLCPDCGAEYSHGRWTWPQGESKADRSGACPACRRIKDRCPAGELVLKGKIDAGLRDQILRRVRHIEEEERGQHPLHRIISIDDEGAETFVRTTDVHLPHRFGHAIKDAWGGELDTHYDLEGYFARIVWQPKSG